jgi:HAE1 family hydrophobic/amphiphilic exporter-1
VELHQIAKKILEPQFERIEGVASVVVTGGEELELLIELDETKMLADRLEVNQVAQAIQNANVNASGGWIEEGARRYQLKAVGELNTLEEIADVTIGRRESVPIRCGGCGWRLCPARRRAWFG